MEISGKIVDVVKRSIYKGTVVVKDGRIEKIRQEEGEVPDRFIMPGLVDAHVHIESSMLTPVGFGAMALRQGTIAVVTDPHEIANVLGVEGIRFMVQEGGKTALKIKFGIPSCVPATPFETSGAVIGPGEIEALFREDKNFHLAEMMNFPGVIYGDKDVRKKLEVAKKYNRIIDGHAPGVRGEALRKYAETGISTDHECTTLGEAVEKIEAGMKILIREGSAARDFNALSRLIEVYPDEVMLCTDDSHPDDLAEGHINRLVERALEKGYDLWYVLRAATLNPVRFYGIGMGLLQEGDPADFIVTKKLEKIVPERVVVDGHVVYEGKDENKMESKGETPNRFNAEKIEEKDLRIKAKSKKIKVIVAEEGSLATGERIEPAKIDGGCVVSDTDRDVLKIMVYNRYEKGNRPAIGFIKGFGMKQGALAASIAHDSHNIIAVGATDKEIVQAINRVVEMRGGIVTVVDGEIRDIPLPVAGLMTREDGISVAERYKEINAFTKRTGTHFRAPFMTLSFMALLVIPELKISDKGLFRIDKMQFQELFVEG